MASLEYGTSSPQVAGLQKLLNKTFGYDVPEDGSFDDKTMQAVEDLGQKIGVKVSSDKVDASFFQAMKEAAMPRCKVVVNGKEAWVTKAQYATLKEKAGKRAGDAVRTYVSMANEAKMLWDAHDKARKDNWFWSNAVDVAVGTNFPDRGMMDRAVKAAEKMEADARACNLTEREIGNRSGPIREAFAAMDQYREELFGGGDELVKNLEVIRDSCVLTLQITSAIATGGASWEVQVGVSASVAAYEQVLKEADTASKTANYDVSKGVFNVFLSGILDGTVNLILKGGGAGKFLDDVAKEAVEKAGSKWLKAYAIKAVNGGAQQMIKDGIKGLQGLTDPKKKFDREDFLKAAVESFLKGAALKMMGDTLEKFGKGTAKFFSDKDFKGLGEVKLDKAGAEGLKKLLDKKAPDVIKKVMDKWDSNDDPAKLQQQLIDEMLTMADIRAAVKEAEANQKKGGGGGGKR